MKLMTLAGIVLIGYGVAICTVEKIQWYRFLWIIAGAGLIVVNQIGITLPTGIVILCYAPAILIFSLVIWIHCSCRRTLREGEHQDAKAVIILGCKVGCRSFNERLAAAETYLRQHPDTTVICSGAKGNDEPGSEGEIYAHKLKQKGIDEKRIRIEKNSYNTWENIMKSMVFIEDKKESVGIVTSGYHVYRSVCIARKYGLEHVFGIGAETILFYVPDYELREGLAMIKGKLTGEL